MRRLRRFGLRLEEARHALGDFGEVGADHTVTALYELVPAGAEKRDLTKADALRYKPEAGAVGELVSAARIISITPTDSGCGVATW